LKVSGGEKECPLGISIAWGSVKKEVVPWRNEQGKETELRPSPGGCQGESTESTKNAGEKKGDFSVTTGYAKTSSDGPKKKVCAGQGREA